MVLREHSGLVGSVDAAGKLHARARPQVALAAQGRQQDQPDGQRHRLRRQALHDDGHDHCRCLRKGHRSSRHVRRLPGRRSARRTTAFPASAVGACRRHDGEAELPRLAEPQPPQDLRARGDQEIAAHDPFKRRSPRRRRQAAFDEAALFVAKSLAGTKVVKSNSSTTRLVAFRDRRPQFDAFRSGPTTHGVRTSSRHRSACPSAHATASHRTRSPHRARSRKALPCDRLRTPQAIKVRRRNATEHRVEGVEPSMRRCADSSCADAGRNESSACSRTFARHDRSTLGTLQKS